MVDLDRQQVAAEARPAGGIGDRARAIGCRPFSPSRISARDCVYHELQTCWENGLDDHRILKERERTYRAEGMPAHSGLIEGHFMVRRHNDPALVRFGDRWLEHVLRYSRRDQVSFPYLVWRLGLSYEFITALDWRGTVESRCMTRKTRKTDFRRKNVLYQEARKVYHRLKGRG